RRVAVIGGVAEHGRNDLLGGRDLRDHRLEPREEQGADVELARLEPPDDLLRDVARVVELDEAHRAQLDRLDDLFLEQAPQLVETLAPDAEELDLLAFVHQRKGALAGEPYDRGVERAAQAAVAGADDEQMRLVAAGAGEEFRCRLVS